MKCRALLVTTLLFLPLLTHAAPPKDHAAIRKVIQQFSTAIVQKDKQGFLTLFAQPPILWRTVLGDTMLKKIRQRHAGADKAPFNPRHNYRQFIDFVSGHKGPVKETFRNIRIDSDGDVASVNFDYTFRMDRRETNRGQESWQLLHTDAGWRIVSVVWSTHLPPGH
ncbi:DUF4440 domain-containing protein [Oleiagrimonas sp. C23AA]|uniref:DUF4440 domain-containing protein n=1 Tax=Oleiagrimonas sp. C23AA TaxID=2719047 RepID=UPI001423F47F|nr:DUF4440 domain-containing protein [Oleiagrimonas sp. C23AA]NII11064.1 nuclear transport factor 2 family protein [Oleiagrimonas sp. C23AA]